MKIRRLNEDAKRFYVDEIVSAPGGKTETERHSFATIDELKQYCKDAGLTKDDIANCGGCDVKDLCENLVKDPYYDSLAINEPKIYLPTDKGNKVEVSIGAEKQDEDDWDIYVEIRDNGDFCFEIPSSRLADEIDEIRNPRLTYLTYERAEELCNQIHSYFEDIDQDDIYATLVNKLGCNKTKVEQFWNAAGLQEDLNKDAPVSKLHTKPNGEYLVKADSGKGYTAFSRDNVAIGGIDNEDADSDDKAIAKFKKNEYSECLNEEYFDTAEYRIQKYEDDIPELMAGMHDDYMEGKLDAARYAEVLKKVYDALAECDHKQTMSEPVVTNGSGKRVLDALAKLDKTNEALGIGAGLALGGAAIGAGMIGSSLLDSVEDENKEEETELNELFDIEIDAKGFGGSGNNVHVGPGSMPLTASVEDNEDDTSLNEGSEKYYAAKYTAVDNSGNKTVKKICFRCDGTIEDAEKEVDALIKEPYTELKVIGSCLKGVAEKDGYKLIESVDKEEVVNMPRFSKLKAEVEKLAEKTGLTVYVSEPEQDGDNVDLWCSEIFDIEGTGLVDVIELSDDESEYVFDSDAIENHLVSVCLTDENEYDYDDDYSDAYDELLDECSGIKAHKVIMGEGIDDIGIDGDLGEEGPAGDKTEDIEFVMEEYIAESLLIDFVEKVDALTYKVGANDQVVTVVFDPKWSEYVYTIDGKGPYSHRSYEFISRDIYDYVMSTTSSDYELDDIVD